MRQYQRSSPGQPELIERRGVRAPAHVGMRRGAELEDIAPDLGGDRPELGLDVSAVEVERSGIAVATGARAQPDRTCDRRIIASSRVELHAQAQAVAAR